MTNKKRKEEDEPPKRVKGEQPMTNSNYASEGDKVSEYSPAEVQGIKKELEGLDGEALYRRTFDLVNEGKLTLDDWHVIDYQGIYERLLHSEFDIAKLKTMNARYRIAVGLDGKDKVMFDVSDFVDYIVDGGLKKGNSVILDDAGVFMNSRDWQTVQNKAISIVAQSFRYRNLITFITVPKWNYIDAILIAIFKSPNKLYDFLFPWKLIRVVPGRQDAFLHPCPGCVLQKLRYANIFTFKEAFNILWH